MKGFSACIEMLFTELPFAERARAALDCGYRAVEFWSWHDKDLSALKKTGAPVALSLLDSADDARRARYGEIGMLTEESPDLFCEILEETFAAITPLGARLAVALPGQARSDRSREAQEESIIACLRAAREILEQYDVSLAIEPLNQFDHTGCYLSHAEQAFRIVRAAESGRIGVLYDIYHQQITEGNLIQTITENVGLIKHLHVADVPGRHEPGTGEIHYRNVLAAAREAGYAGYVGCEFMPTGDSAEASRHVLTL